MIHGVYIKNRPKHKWHLVAVSSSPEVASNDIINILNQAKLEGNDLAEAAIQTYDPGAYIPEFLSEIKNQKLMYN